MGKGAGQRWTEIPANLVEWLTSAKVPLWFVGTAPLHGSHVNISPKGYPHNHLSILSPSQVRKANVVVRRKEESLCCKLRVLIKREH